MRRIASIWLIAWITAAVLAALNYDPLFHLESTLAVPSLKHPFGCDSFGRELWALVPHAAATSGLFALASAGLALLAGTLGGTLLAMMQGKMRFVGQRILEFFLAFPSLLLALGFAAIWGPGWNTLLFSLFVGALPGAVRLAQTKAEAVSKSEFIVAARSLGATEARIMLWHVAPAVMGILVVKFPNAFAHALVAEAMLSFFGVGAPIGKNAWGALLAQGKNVLIEAPHVAIAVGLPLFLTIAAVQSLSEHFEAR